MGNDDLRQPLAKDGGPLVDSFYTEERSLMFNMAWPMMISFFCRMGMASVDSAFVGHIEDGGFQPKEFLAAAGLSDMVTNILIIPPLAFNMSLNALVSQAMGAGNKKMAGVWLQLSVFFLTLAYLPCLASFFFVADMLRWLGFSENICVLAGQYARWNVFWPIPNGWYQCMRFYFQAQGNTRPAMYNNMIFLFMNALLNWIFVFGGPFRALFGWQGFGFIGAAMSLSCSRSLQPLFYWLYMFVWKKNHQDTWPGWSFDFLSRERVKTFMDQSLPQVGTLIFQAALGQTTTLLIAQLGNLAIAASAAATALTQIFTGGLSASLNAVCGIRVGFHLGRGHGAFARRAALMIFSFSLGSVALISAMLLPFSHDAVSVMTSDPEVVALAAQLLPPVLLNTFCGLIVECNTGGVFTSQGRTILSTVLSMGVELPLNIGSVAFLVLYLHWGLVPVYWAQAMVSFLEMLLVLVLFSRSDWERYAKETKMRQELEDAEARSTGRRMSPATSSPLSQMYKSPVRSQIAMAADLAPSVAIAAEADAIAMTIEEL
mmetsp:Transcript_90844/g.261759  ORF Transcript_90844/g.261759 Transcript_90844/m.261759 type:complete len:544 (+) Transcript_90844:93-1724(+)|eukprot:CAMPEP_0176043142 /NCGR_PEP_ID=MMETSP0120_2-20121206/21408_1 /TAXON_ID=160619 /ORGANISM="Kryptoperidinium foliaceum, Strain CCMP 1326" /LENGTH=543 /DNA_ID=CAMNT_0017376549 /DNA_START=85 /DNA_END=1716 /DNA_ORIENTATION=+